MIGLPDPVTDSGALLIAVLPREFRQWQEGPPAALNGPSSEPELDWYSRYVGSLQTWRMAGSERL